MYEIYLKINYSTRFLCIAMKDLSFISTMNVDKDDILLDKSLITLFKQNNKHFFLSVLIQDLRFFFLPLSSKRHAMGERTLAQQG